MVTEGEWEYRYNNQAGVYELGSDKVGYIGRIGLEKDARRIVTAVNCHEDLVGLAKKWRTLVAMSLPEHLPAIDAVLAKAKGNP